MNTGSWLSWWKRAWKRGGSQVSQRRGKGRPRAGERRAYLRLEQLEDRTVPTNNIPLHPVNWTPLGPVAINPGGNQQQPWSGPIASVASSPAAPNVWYVATVGGGRVEERGFRDYVDALDGLSGGTARFAAGVTVVWDDRGGADECGFCDGGESEFAESGGPVWLQW
jgi:hypothetical protein